MRTNKINRALPFMVAALLLAFLVLLLYSGLSGAQSAAPPASNAPLTVYFFPTGKSDAILLKTENASVLIDTAGKETAPALISELESLGVTELDCLILTHFDKDHCGGAAKILQRFPVARLLQSNCPQDNAEYRKYTSAVNLLAGLTAETVTEDLSFTLDGVSFTVYAPAASYAEEASNNSSLVVSVLCGGRSLLFTGDACAARLQELLNHGLSRHDFIKMPHHGEYTGLLPAFLGIVEPSSAVITCSAQEPESAKTAALLAERGIGTYLTREGLVLLTCDGETISLSYGS